MKKGSKYHFPSKLLTAVVAIAASTLTPSIANSQSNSGCFMTDEAGNIIDLSNLCGTGSPGVLQAPIKRRLGGIPTIDVTFNGSEGRQTFEMLFDTGASGISITPAMAEALGVKPEGVGITLTAGGPVEVPLGRIRTVEAGGVVARDLVVSINRNLDLGLLGQNFFGGYDVTIKENVIEFRRR